MAPKDAFKRDWSHTLVLLALSLGQMYEGATSLIAADANRYNEAIYHLLWAGILNYWWQCSIKHREPVND